MDLWKVPWALPVRVMAGDRRRPLAGPAKVQGMVVLVGGDLLSGRGSKVEVMWGGKVDLQGPTMDKVPWQGTLARWDVAF